jgi:CheY-like chemotaxis protein
MTGGNRSIISVEDSDTDFMALQFALQAAGINNPIERCSSGHVVMDSLLAGDTCPLSQKASLILLDLNLPGVDGRQLLKEFRARDQRREVPVIVLSTSSHPRDIDYCYKAGADAYLVKPLELDDWEKKIGALVGYWLKTTQPCHQPDPNTKARTAGRNRRRRSQLVDERDYEGCRDQLTRAIEHEIIPRLLLAHGGEQGQDTRFKQCVPHAPCSDEIAELARLVMEQDVAVAATFVERKLDKGATLETVFMAFIAPAARFVGDLWKADLCSFAQFSLALERLNQLLLELSPTRENETMH